MTTSDTQSSAQVAPGDVTRETGASAITLTWPVLGWSLPGSSGSQG